MEVSFYENIDNPSRDWFQKVQEAFDIITT